MPAACSVFRPCDFFDGLSEIRPGHHGWAFVFRRELEQELFGRERFQLIHVDEQNKKKFFGVYTAMRWSEGDMNGPEFLTLKPKVREAIIMHLSIGRASDVAPMLAASQTTVSCVILRCVMGVELPLEKAGLLASVGFKDFLEETRVRRFQEYDENRFRYIQDKPNSFSRGTVFSAPVAPIPPKLDPSNALPHDPYMQGPGSRAGAPRRGTPHQTPPSQHMTIAQSNTPQGLGTLPQAATDSSGRRLSIPQAASHDPVPPPRHSYNPTPSASEASQSDGPSSCHGGSQHGSDHVPAIPRSPLHFGHGHPGNAYGQGPNMQEPQIAPPNHVNRPVFQSNGYPRAQHHGSQPSWNPPPPSYFGRQLQNTAYPGMVRSNQHVQPQTSGMVRHVGATNTNVYSTLAHSNGSNATPQRYPPPYAAPPIVHGRALKDNPNWAPAPFKHEVRMAKGDRAQAPPGIMMRGPATSVSGAPRAQLQPIRTSPAQRYTVPLRKISEEKDKDAATGGQENAGA
ncbi:hypothetical protein PLICRDRAFT_606297 [Plicaturopsis crispa FD-325 SS-3]|nr:hypothetical protein PLICRDRAFT_606297 [Plicaturopsis crispa FD-325 SS-3]